MDTKNHHILLAEDNIDFGHILKQYLEISGYFVTWAKDGVEALDIFKKEVFQICVLDVMMPKMDGFSLAEHIIDENPGIPFIFLTARSLKDDKIKGLKLGADDYIIKPFDADELVLRIQNIIKRTLTSSLKTKEEIIVISKYYFNSRRLTLTFNETSQQITEKEASLIQYLYQHKNQVLKRDEILNAVWKNNDYFSGRSMDVFISRLRKYFKEDPSISIESYRGIGLEFKIR